MTIGAASQRGCTGCLFTVSAIDGPGLDFFNAPLAYATAIDLSSAQTVSALWTAP